MGHLRAKINRSFQPLPRAFRDNAERHKKVKVPAVFQWLGLEDQFRVDLVFDGRLFQVEFPVLVRRHRNGVEKGGQTNCWLRSQRFR